MTFQPPSSPSDETPPNAPAPGGWAPPPAPTGGGSNRPSGFDPKSVNLVDWVLMGIGAVVLIFGFFDYISFSAGGYSDSIGAWHFSHWTFLTWFAMVFGVLGGATAAVETFAPQVKLPIPPRVLGVELFLASFVLYFIAIFLHPDFASGPGYSYGHGFSFWFSLVLSLVGVVAAIMRAQQTNASLPGPLASIPTLPVIGAK